MKWQNVVVWCILVMLSAIMGSTITSLCGVGSALKLSVAWCVFSCVTIIAVSMIEW